jgi:uncharacterized protein (TIGR02453 family)
MLELNIPPFNGFSRGSLSFLKANHAANNRTWFEAHREQYRQQVLLPFQSLVCDLSEIMLDIDPWFEVRPAVDKTISRIYRDTRFSRDKTLYRENIWLTFKRPAEQWTGNPAFYFELYPTWYRYGMGYYSASAETMSRFRQEIDKRPKEFLKVIRFYTITKVYSLEGEKYKRKMVHRHPSAIAEWYERKNFYLVYNKKIDRVLLSSRLVEQLKEDFQVLKPLYRFLIKLNESQ